MTERSGPRAGFALVTVLWIVLILSLIAASLMASGRLGLLRTRHAVETTQARALADGAVERVVLDLLRAYLSGSPAPRPAALALPADGGSIDVRIEDEDGKIDLNRAEPPLLAGLFVQAGLAPAEAAALVDAVADFRDPDDLRRLHGAEDEDYAKLGRPEGAKDAAFDSVDELLQVAGVTPELFWRIAPALTVYSGRATIDPTVAPRLALQALPGVDSRLADFLANFRPGRPRSAASGPLPDLSKVQTMMTPSRHQVFTVRAVARTQGGAAFVREAVVQLSKDVNRPYAILAWRQGEVTGAAVGSP
ncbi:MAG TPA: hypothetical protein VD978_29460 [Azospirillum sp.]|nr:hypothetical protein [Azospirillum sp.]